MVLNAKQESVLLKLLRLSNLALRLKNAKREVRRQKPTTLQFYYPQIQLKYLLKETEVDRTVVESLVMLDTPLCVLFEHEGVEPYVVLTPGGLSKAQQIKSAQSA